MKAIKQIFLQRKLPISLRLGIVSCLLKGDIFKKIQRPITFLKCFLFYIQTNIRIYHPRNKNHIRLSYFRFTNKLMKGIYIYIGKNTRIIYDLMSNTEINNLPGSILIDFEKKAFDSVSWSFVTSLYLVFWLWKEFFRTPQTRRLTY